jgi:hypothetical protein
MRLQELVECSGYIPKNAEEAKDPRWSRALSVDVHPDTMKKEIAVMYPTKAVGSKYLTPIKN